MVLPSSDSEIRAQWVGEPGPTPGGPGAEGLPCNPPYQGQTGVPSLSS